MRSHEYPCQPGMVFSFVSRITTESSKDRILPCSLCRTSKRFGLSSIWEIRSLMSSSTRSSPACSLACNSSSSFVNRFRLASNASMSSKKGLILWPARILAYQLAEETYRDLGVSAWKGRNFREGGLCTFREAVRQGAIKQGATLVVENLDRLSREEVDIALSVFSEILRAGITIVTLSPERVYTRASLHNVSQVVEAILTFILANEESEKKSQRLRAVWQRKRQEGGKIGPNPAWLRWDGEKYCVIPEKAKVVRQVYEWAGSGIGNFAIIRHLTETKVPNFGRGKGWNPSYVSLLLRSRAVIGERVFADGSVIKGYYPAVIDRGLFFKVQDHVRLRNKKANFRGRGARLCRNLFSGLLKDARDGGSLTVFHRQVGGDPKRKRMVIGSYNAMRGGPVPFIGFPFEELEVALLLELRELRTEDFFGAPQKPQKAEIQILEGELGETVDNLEALQPLRLHH